MKNLLLLLAFISLNLTMGQQILPLNTFENIPNGAYLKDLDNVLSRYVGTWEGVLSNKKYTFVFTKFPQQPQYNSSDYNVYRDEIKGKFKVTDLSTGNILYSSLSAVAYDDYPITTTDPNTSRGLWHLYIIDTPANCYNHLEFYLRKIIGQPNKLTYCYFSYAQDLGYDCPNFVNRAAIPMFLPKNELILTKQ